MSDRDRHVGRMLEHVVVPPADGFWRDLDVLLQLEDLSGGRNPEHDPSGGEQDDESQFIETTITEIGEHRNRRRQPVFLVAAAVLLIVLTLGLMQVDRAGDPNLIAGPGLETTTPDPAADAPATNGPAVDEATTNEAATDEPTADVEGEYSGPLTRIDAPDGSFGGLELATPNETLVIPTTHDLDVDGIVLTSEFVSDGNGGFLYGLIDYDDTRSDRSSRLLHVSADAVRPVVVATEEQNGIGSVLGVVDDPTGTLVVYTTLLGSTTRIVPLTGGVPVDLSPLEAVAVGGDLIVVANDDSCRSLSLIDTRGEPSNLVSPSGDDACGPSSATIYEQGLSPDGRQIAWLEDGDRRLKIVDLVTSKTILEKDLGASSFHVTRFDGTQVLLTRMEAGGIEQTVVDLDGVIRSEPDAIDSVQWDRYRIHPDLVLGLS